MGRKRKVVSVTLSDEVLKKVDEACKVLELSRSQVVENFLQVAFMDYEVLKNIGLIKLANYINKLRELKSKDDLDRFGLTFE